MTSDNVEDQESRNAEALAALKQAYKAGQLVLFVGAGISRAAGLPGWNELAKALLKRAQQQSMPNSDVADLNEQIAKEHFPEVFSELKRYLGEPQFFEFIEAQLQDGDKPVPRAAETIARLAPGIRTILTTNLDHFLERAFKGEWPSLARPARDNAQKQKYILKLHGTLQERSTWVFTKEDYERIVFAEPNLKAVFTSLFHTCHVLFVGYGLLDYDLEAHLGEIKAVCGPHFLRHFAILPAGSMPRRRLVELQRAGLTILSYESKDGDHEGLNRLLMRVSSGDIAPENSQIPPKILPPEMGSALSITAAAQVSANAVHYSVTVEENEPPVGAPDSSIHAGIGQSAVSATTTNHKNISAASAGGATTLLVVLAVLVFLNKNNPHTSPSASSSPQPKTVSAAPQRTAPSIGIIPTTPSSNGQKEAVSAVVRPATLRELRKRNHTVGRSQVQPGETAADLPSGTYGFINISDVTLLPDAPLQLERAGSLEIHRLSSGELQIVGWVLPVEAAGMDVGGEVTVALSPSPTTQSRTLVSIPLKRVRIAKAIRWQQGQAVQLDLAGLNSQ